METLSDSFRSGKSQSMEILRSNGYTNFHRIGGRRRTGLPKLIRRGRRKSALMKIDGVVPRYHHMLVCSRYEVI
jgi:hypothetical protein